MGVREALLRAGIATATEVDEALARQQLYGADLVTNLLELVELDEGTVQRVLAEVYGLALAPTGELPYAAAAAIELVPRTVASDLNVYPFRLEDGVLSVVASMPLSERASVDLGFALKVQVRALFALAPRIKQAIARDYAFALDKRTSKALAKLDRASRVSMTEPPPPLAEVRTMSQFPRPRSIAPFGFPENWSDSVTPEAARIYAETARQPDVRLRNPNDLAESPETSRSIFGQYPSQPEFPGVSLGSEVPPSSEARPPVSRRPGHEVRHESRQRRRGPYTVAAAKLDLGAAKSGEDVLEVFFDFAAQFFDYTAAFALHGDVAEVRAARGRGGALELLPEQLPLSEHPSLRRVSESRTWALVELSKEDPELATLLLRNTGQPCLLLPVAVKDRTVIVLYGGFDAEAVALGQVGELLAFSPLVAQALEHTILARKGGLSGGGLGTGRLGTGQLRTRPKFAAPSAEDRAKALAQLLTDEEREGTG